MLTFKQFLKENKAEAVDKYNKIIARQRFLETGLKAALKDHDNTIYTGDTHHEAYKAAPKHAQERLKADMKDGTFDKTHRAGFVDTDNNWYSRRETESIFKDSMLGGHAEGIAKLRKNAGY